jgi:hypothetical protein
VSPFADRVGQKKSVAAPDPFGIAIDNVAGVRLFESKLDRQMARRTYTDRARVPLLDAQRALRTVRDPDGAEAILQLRAAVLSDDDRLRTYIENRAGNAFRRPTTTEFAQAA